MEVCQKENIKILVLKMSVLLLEAEKIYQVCPFVYGNTFRLVTYLFSFKPSSYNPIQKYKQNPYPNSTHPLHCLIPLLIITTWIVIPKSRAMQNFEEEDKSHVNP